MLAEFWYRKKTQHQVGFETLLRRQGWHLVECKPLYTDPQVIQILHTVSPRNTSSDATAFHSFLARNTVRKIIRAILVSPQPRENLEKLCPNVEKLDQILTVLHSDGIVIKENGVWKKGPECSGIDNFGPTLEWWVAEWFRKELEVQARHGVHLEEIPDGGDLDVVAFVNDIRVWVECKACDPDAITESMLCWFMQRANHFNPEVALLLVDTTSSIKGLVDRLNSIYYDLYLQQAKLTNPTMASDVQITVPKIEAQQELPGQRRQFKSLYWGFRNIYVTNVQKSIGSSLDSVLRHYYSQAQHYLYLLGPDEYDWNYVKGTVNPISQQD